MTLPAKSQLLEGDMGDFMDPGVTPTPVLANVMVTSRTSETGGGAQMAGRSSAGDK